MSSRAEVGICGGRARENLTLALLWLALPMIGMTLSRMLMGLIDFVMVSKLDTASQAAIYPCTLLLFTIACVGMGMAQGVQTFVSQAEGRGESQRAGAYLSQTIVIAAAATLVSAPLAWLCPAWVSILGGAGHHPAEVQQMEVRFLTYALWSIGPMSACAGLESFYNGIKRPIIAFFAVLASLVTITVANYALIFGHWGFPAMGIAGSGLATLLAWCVRLCVLLVPLASRKLDERYHTLRGFRPGGRQLLDIVRVGSPISFQWLVDIGAWLVFVQLMVPPYGEVAMAAAGIAIQFMHLSFMPALGLGIALTTQVGNEVGAGRPEEAALRVRVARRVICTFMGAMALLFALAGRPLAELLCFEQDSAVHGAVVTTAASMLLWVALFQLSDAMCIVYSFALRGAGDTRGPAVLFAACCWGIFVAGGSLLLWLTPRFGYHGPWAMCAAYIIILGLLLMWRFNSRAWEKIRLFDHQDAGAVVASAAAEPGGAGAAEPVVLHAE